MGEQGGLQPGGLNFDAKVRRESTDIEDLFIGHINGMDTYARGLRAAAKLIADGSLDEMVTSRYAGFDSTEAGRKIADAPPHSPRWRATPKTTCRPSRGSTRSTRASSTPSHTARPRRRREPSLHPTPLYSLGEHTPSPSARALACSFGRP